MYAGHTIAPPAVVKGGTRGKLLIAAQRSVNRLAQYRLRKLTIGQAPFGVFR
jgi:hypothetical protein